MRDESPGGNPGAPHLEAVDGENGQQASFGHYTVAPLDDGPTPRRVVLEHDGMRQHEIDYVIDAARLLSRTLVLLGHADAHVWIGPYRHPPAAAELEQRRTLTIAPGDPPGAP